MNLPKRKMRLGDILKAQGIVTDKQLEATLAIQQKTKQKLGDILIETGITTESQITNALHSQLGIDMIELRGIRIPPEVIGLVSGSILRKHKVLPVGFDEKDSNALILAMADPLDMVAQDDIAIITNRRIEPRVATVGAINSVLDRYFGNEEAMTAAEQYTRARSDRWTGLPGTEPAVAAFIPRLCPAGPAPFFGHDHGEHPVRPAGRYRRGSHRGLKARLSRRRCRQAAGRLFDGGR